MPIKMNAAECAEEIENRLCRLHPCDRIFYAMNYAASILRKVDRGELVEVVRCEECRFKDRPSCPGMDITQGMTNLSLGYCERGQRKDEYGRIDNGKDGEK